MNRDSTQKPMRPLAGSILIFLPGLALASSGILKLAHVPAVVSRMAAFGFSDGKLTLVAVLEVSSAALFLFPRTRSLGLLMLSAFLGGAICTHVQLGEYSKVGGPSVLLSLAWIGTWLRHPEAFWSLNLHGAAVNRLATKNESWASPSV
jgi:DoxX-like family